MGIMGKRLTIADHLTEEEIEQYYRISTDGIERSQWQIIWLLKKGKKSEEVAQVHVINVGWAVVETDQISKSIKLLNTAHH
ncbi:hypothetical protein [Moorena sp. SIO4G3]|uniref:hypothetical protein n=1 Tax=Moorena sp. SIO4G3 TaxID=2607821 RepID=UPI00142CB8C3|nr:hypothetical protein [Moorena sp. SIO4G3]NEO76788.1 hypothetical protein [Moorena sp. SIO4G3]